MCRKDENENRMKNEIKMWLELRNVANRSMLSFSSHVEINAQDFADAERKV